MRPELQEALRLARKTLDMIEEDMQLDVPHVDDRDEANYLAERLKVRAEKLQDLIGNTQANDSIKD